MCLFPTIYQRAILRCLLQIASDKLSVDAGQYVEELITWIFHGEAFSCSGVSRHARGVMYQASALHGATALSRNATYSIATRRRVCHERVTERLPGGVWPGSRRSMVRRAR